MDHFVVIYFSFPILISNRVEKNCGFNHVHSYGSKYQQTVTTADTNVEKYVAVATHMRHLQLESKAAHKSRNTSANIP